MHPVWKLIHPKLEALLKEKKELELQRAFESRYRLRCNELLPFWTAFVANFPPAERNIMPGHADLCDLPAVKAILSEGDAQTPLTEQTWLVLAESVPSIVEKFQTSVKRDLAGYLRSKPPDWQTVRAQRLRPEPPDCYLSILEKPSSLFSCTHCKELVGYPAMFSHGHMCGLGWSHVAGKLQYEQAVESTVDMVLKVLELPEHTSLADTEELDGRLMCLCGHPKFREPMTFRSLVRFQASYIASF